LKLSVNEVAILKEILKHCSHTYTRNFRCSKCEHISEEEFQLHDAAIKNSFGNMVCKNCGETRQWEDVKIKRINIDIKKVKSLEIIEPVRD
jgi:transcription elongation factor Elf1